MKNKKSLYILVPVVILVWGLIIFRVVKMSQPDILMLDTNHINLVNSDTVLYPELTKLKLNYSDPFLRISAPSEIAENGSNEFSSLFNKNPEPEKKKTEWPEIVYKGKVENGSKTLGILQINGKRWLVSKDEIIEAIEVVKIYKDSLLLEKEKERKVFYK